jgi:three-Cys-motif partner protein
MARYWGFWTVGKLDLLRRYLNAFKTTTKNRSEHVVYLDLFGGQPQNRERFTEADIDGSARIALSVDDPPFTVLRFFEMEPYASKLSTALAADFPNRNFEVIAGDCNTTVRLALAGLREVNWAPTFAFVDPNGPDIHWSTLEALAKFKRSDRAKTEMWLLVAAGTFMRNLHTDGTVPDSEAVKLNRMYGTEQWRAIFEGKVAGDLTAGDAREEYVNLMRWRLETLLGYKFTHSLEIFNTGGASIYHMVFATDHPVGHEIMSSLYNAAATELPEMRQQARRRKKTLELEATGISSLFGDELDVSTAPLARGEKLYSHTPPWIPYGAVDVDDIDS